MIYKYNNTLSSTPAPLALAEFDSIVHFEQLNLLFYQHTERIYIAIIIHPDL